MQQQDVQVGAIDHAVAVEVGATAVAQARTEATSGGGVVKVSVIGGSHVESIEIDPEVIDPEDVEMLQDLILAAVNEAMESAQKLAADKMGEITGGMNIPGLT